MWPCLGDFQVVLKSQLRPNFSIYPVSTSPVGEHTTPSSLYPFRKTKEWLLSMGIYWQLLRKHHCHLHLPHIKKERQKDLCRISVSGTVMCISSAILPMVLEVWHWDISPDVIPPSPMLMWLFSHEGLIGMDTGLISTWLFTLTCGAQGPWLDLGLLGWEFCLFSCFVLL